MLRARRRGEAIGKLQVQFVILQVAEEWATARAEAAKAKAAADKPRQKAAGQVIAGLKREITQLGATPTA